MYMIPDQTTDLIFDGIVLVGKKLWIPNNEENADWKEYQIWLAEDPTNNVADDWDQATYDGV